MRKEMELLLSKLDDIKKLLEQLVTNQNQPDNSNDVPITIAQAAAYLHLSASHVYSLIYSGDLHPLQKRKSGRTVFLRQELIRYLEGKEQKEKNRSHMPGD